jgi:glutamate decarboxylase
MQGLDATTSHLAQAIEAVGRFEILSKPNTVPLVCFRLAEEAGGNGHRPYTVFDISAHLRQRGWIVPAYSLAPNAEHISVLRVVVRENFSRDMANLLADDLARTIEHLEQHGPSHLAASPAPSGPARVTAAAAARPHPKGHKSAREVC